MNIHHLRYFYDACILNSVSKAARKNKVSQSAVSLAVKSLEQELNCELITHVRNQFQVTELGHVVFQECSKVFRATDNISILVQNHAQNYTGELNIAVSHSVAHTFFPVILKEFQTKYPNIHVKIHATSCPDITDLVLNGLTDLGLVVEHKPHADLQTEILSTGKYNLVFHKDFKKPAEESWLLSRSKNSYEVKDFINEQSNYKNPIKFHAYMEFTSWDLIKTLVLNQLGYALLPDYIIAQELISKEILSYKKVKPIASYQIQAIIPKGRILSKNIKLLLDIFKNTKL